MRIARLRAAFLLTCTLLVAGCASHPKASPPQSPSAIAADIPRDRAPETSPRIEVTGDTTPSLIRVDKDQEVVVRVRVHGLPLAAKKRPPLNLALVVDTSGSMEGEPIDQARDACARLVDLLSDGDALSIVTFGSRANVILPSTRITKDTRASAKVALRSIKAEGTTDMAAGLSAGLTQIRSHLSPDGIHRIVLVGDGVPNDAPSVLSLADSAKSVHVPVTALGLGNDFDETLMTSLAQRSSGSFHFVADAARVASVFEEQISRMERVVARGARIELTPGPGVTITEVIGTPTSPNGHMQVASLGDFAEGQTRDVFVRVKAKGRRDGKKIELVDARVSYTLPEGGPELSSDVYLKLEGSTDAARVASATVLDIEHGFTTMRVADGIIKAIALARDGDLGNARAVLDTSVRLAKEGEKKFSDKALGEKVIEMTKLRKTLPALAPPPDAMSAMDPSGPSKTKMAPRPAPPSASPKEALELRAAHGGAMSAIQGDE